MLRSIVLATLFASALAALAAPAAAQQRQVPDTSFIAPDMDPLWTEGGGPRVAVDEAHHNFHQADDRFLPFATLLRRDGCTVRGLDKPFTPEALRDVDLLVIANALAERNVANWSLPTPSAFTDEEIVAVRRWVEEGGSLLLIADHMPFPGAAGELAAAFGVELVNGFARGAEAGGRIVFTRAAGLNPDHPVVHGPAGRVDTVISFTGEAFRAPDARAVLVMPPGSKQVEPTVAWQFDDDMPRVDVTGWKQGVTLEHGLGRVAVFGEAAMFTAQVLEPGGARFGMNLPEARGNITLVRNLVWWLVER